MALYVDRLIDYTGRVPYRHKVWCHLVADTDEELLAAAADLGGSPEWLQGSRGWDTHFDLPAPWRAEAVALGAEEVDFRFMALRTRSRRAAIALGGARAVGAPTGTSVEVPLPEGDGWQVGASPEGVEVTWRHDHPLLGDRTVAVLSGEGDRAGLVRFTPVHPTTDPTDRDVDPGFAVGVVWSSRAR